MLGERHRHVLMRTIMITIGERDLIEVLPALPFQQLLQMRYQDYYSDL